MGMRQLYDRQEDKTAEIKDIPAPVWWIEVKVGEASIYQAPIDAAAEMAALHGQNRNDFELFNGFKIRSGAGTTEAPVGIRLYKAPPLPDYDE